MEKQTPVLSPREFKIPLEFLKTFQADMRVIPPITGSNGYITFDWDMLVSVLRNGDPAVRERYATAIHALKSQWECVLVNKAEETAPAIR